MAITLQEKYRQERDARLNEKGLGQYLDKSKTADYILHDDPWVAEGTPVQRPVPDGGHVKIVIFGAGFGGLCAATRALSEGSASSVDDLLIIDRAGGFGGTWWHNRYPGLMCDIESYLYLPLLEETGYMPKRKYASGEEIREYSDLVAQKFGLHARAMFQTSGNSLTWDAEAKNWKCEVTVKPKGQAESRVKFTADYVVLSSGGFTEPKIPDIPGLSEFKGKMLHTGRWNYDITGGSPADPVLSNLKGKRVAIIGTGATAIQAVPATAKYAGELYVFQRTASAVDFRGNRDTDPEEWKTKIAAKKGWQAARGINFQAFTEGQSNLPEEDLVSDGFSKMPTISGSWGSSTIVKPEDVESYISMMHELDAIRSDKVRQRALDVVKDQETAKALQAWYPGWCKRPTYHDEYLPAFNQPNVHLVNTAPKGVEALTPNGIMHNGKEYPIDILIWSTGYGSPLTESLAGKAGITVTGKDRLNMEDRFKAAKLMTLHGLIAHNFPNLFYTGFSQAGVGVNQTQRLDEQSQHIAYTIKEAEARIKSKKAVIEPTDAACEDWANQCAARAHMLGTMAGCTPSYFNAEGASDKMTPEQQAGFARTAIWGQGYLSYARILQEWRKNGGLEGFEISSA
ncbi:pyridine nucleotide-disulfide oxidoreductase-like protein [Rhexocercosporidium sp. MPI-PUGE-AT-0058]|nr:pyridine nucleotide-disulfide oxidoreductase-like protein [Rhexocercosporidium sp. MPI-PUGE-AT-0058]